VLWSDSRASITRALREPARLALDHPAKPTRVIEDFTVVPFLKNLHGYTDLITLLRGTFRRDEFGFTPGSMMTSFPHDFRQSVEYNSGELDRFVYKRLTEVRKRVPSAKVIFVAHSMGGLIARHWVAQDTNNADCRGVITLGTPYSGAPKALDVLVNGLYWGHKAIQRRGLSRITADWPGLWDLVAFEKRVIDSTGGRQAPSEIAALDPRGNLASAEARHRAVSERWAGFDRHAGPTLIPYVGLGQGTMTHHRWDGSRLRPERIPFGDEHRLGDATVPHWSALPTELHGTAATNATSPVGERHGRLTTPPDLHQKLLELNEVSPPKRGDEKRDPQTLGFDIEDIVTADESIHGVVLCDDEPCDWEHVKLEATLKTLAGDRKTVEFETTADGQFEVQPVAAGVLSLSAHLDAKNGLRRPVREQIAVLDD